MVLLMDAKKAPKRVELKDLHWAADLVELTVQKKAVLMAAMKVVPNMNMYLVNQESHIQQIDSQCYGIEIQIC